MVSIRLNLRLILRFEFIEICIICSKLISTFLLTPEISSKTLNHFVISSKYFDTVHERPANHPEEFFLIGVKLEFSLRDLVVENALNYFLWFIQQFIIVRGNVS